MYKTERGTFIPFCRCMYENALLTRCPRLSNWLEGMILMCLYVILAVTFWFYPGKQLRFSMRHPYIRS